MDDLVEKKDDPTLLGQQPSIDTNLKTLQSAFGVSSCAVE